MVSSIVEHHDLAHFESFEPLLLKDLVVCRQIRPLSVTHNELELPVFRFHADQEVVVAKFFVVRRQSELHVFELRVHVDAHPCYELTHFDLDLLLVLRSGSVFHPFQRQDLVYSDLAVL